MKADGSVDANIRDGADAITVSESAKRQIAAQASTGIAKLKAPAFFEFPEGVFSEGIPGINGVNVATVHWKL
jgi:hypothetical protein